MKRYITMYRPLVDDYWRDDWGDVVGPDKRSLTVVEPHVDKPQATGLYDATGNELCRLPDERRPVGFLAKWR